MRPAVVSVCNAVRLIGVPYDPLRSVPQGLHTMQSATYSHAMWRLSSPCAPFSKNKNPPQGRLRGILCDYSVSEG